MAKEERSVLRKKIEKDLLAQLKSHKVKGSHYEDLVQDYLSLWDLKCELINDIEVQGIHVNGMHGPKSNPSIPDLHKTNDRMLRVLDALGLKAATPETPKGTPQRKAGGLL